MIVIILFLEFSKVQQELDNIKVPNELKVAEYYHLRKKLDELADEFRSHTNKADVVVNYMQPGRLIKVSSLLLTTNFFLIF